MRGVVIESGCQVKRIYIVVDLEGVSGVRLAEQCSPGSRGWEEARRWMAGDVNAAVAGAFAGGAEEVVVCDSHADCDNLPVDLLDSRAIVEQPFGHLLLPGIDDEFTGIFAVGAHAMAGAAEAFMDHTWNSKAWFKYRLSGDDCGEIGLWAAYAGHFDVPLLLVTGDVAACREAENFVPGVETFAVKQAVSRNRARVLLPSATASHISAAAERAVGRATEVKPSMVDLPTEAEVEYTRTEFADEAARRSGAERADPRTVRRELGSTLDLIKGF
jgi:D-amino peptidase